MANVTCNFLGTGIVGVVLFAEHYPPIPRFAVALIFAMVVVAAVVATCALMDSAPAFVTTDVLFLLWAFALALLDSMLGVMRYQEIAEGKELFLRDTDQSFTTLGYVVLSLLGCAFVVRIAVWRDLSYLRRCDDCRRTVLACAGALSLACFYDPLAFAERAPRLVALCVECGM